MAQNEGGAAAEAPVSDGAKKKTNPILIAILAILGAVIAGLVVWIIARGGDEPTGDGEPTAAGPTAGPGDATPSPNPTATAGPGANGGSSGGDSKPDGNGDLTTSSGLDGLEDPGLNRSDCGSEHFPEITFGGNITMLAHEKYACFEVTTPTFVKVGLWSSDGGVSGSPDLYFNLLGFTSETESQWIDFADDSINYDPELWTVLLAGTYFIETGDYAEAFEDYTAYATPAAQTLRTMPVSSTWAGLTRDSCNDDSVPFVPADGSTTVGTGTGGYVCTFLPADSEVWISATSSQGDDLTLELIGFDINDDAERHWFNDDRTLGDTDPEIHAALPSGHYILGVATFGGVTAENFTITIQQGD